MPVNKEHEANELTDLETIEVSLVDSGANKRTFAIRKSEKDTMEVINAILAAPFEHKEIVAEHIKKMEMSEQAAEAVEAAMQLLSAVQEEMPEYMMKQLMGLAGMSKAEDEDEEAEKAEGDEDEEKPLPVEEGTDEEETEKAEDGEEDEEEMQKRLAALPEDMRGMVEQLWKSNKDAVTKAAELESQIKKAQDEKRLGECVVKARIELGSLPTKADELGAFIKSLDNADEGHSKFILGLLKSTNALIKNSAITGEVGKSTTDAEQLDAVAKAEQMADAMVEKEGIKKGVALGRVWKTNPALYAEYQRQKKGA